MPPSTALSRRGDLDPHDDESGPVRERCSRVARAALVAIVSKATASFCSFALCGTVTCLHGWWTGVSFCVTRMRGAVFVYPRDLPSVIQPI